MLKAWHLPVAPFIKEQQERLMITLWLSGDDLPPRVTLRAEEDNEELSLPMHRLRQAPHPGVVAWRGEINLVNGQPRRRYSFKLLWADRQLWFTPQGFNRFPPARLEQFAVDLPDSGPQWVADQVFYQIFPDRFARSQSREAEQDATYYHHAAGHDIVRKAWDEPLTAEAGGSTFYGGDLDGISEKLPYLKQLGVTALYLNPVFVAPSVHKYDTEDYRRVDPQFGGDAALLRLRHNTQKEGMRLILDGVFNHSGDSHAWFDRHQRGSGGACHNADSPWRDWYNFSQFQPDRIKINRQLVKDIHKHGPKQAIVQAIIKCCNSLEIAISAVGVEQPEEWMWLESAGIIHFQGNLFARPCLGGIPAVAWPEKKTAWELL